MKICEIDNQDRTFAAASGINLNIDEEYTEVVALIQSLIKLKSPHRNAQWEATIESVEDNLRKIVEANFAKDLDTRQLKRKARKMIKEIQTLKNQL